MKKQGLLFTLLLVLALAVFAFSGWKLWSYQHAAKESREVTGQLAEQAVTTPFPGREIGTEPIAAASPEASLPQEPSPTPEYTEYAPLTVNFDALWQQTRDVVAWLFCEDTVINYPIVQGPDNSYYVERLPDGSWNAGGTLFLDVVNRPDFSDFNSIVYGHNMVNGTMFGTLDAYYKQEYYEQHPVMYLMTPEQYYKVELISGAVVPVDSWLYELDFSQPGRKEDILFTLDQLSTFESSVEYSVDDRFLTLSTCTYDYEDARYLLTGKLTPVGGAWE